MSETRDVDPAEDDIQATIDQAITDVRHQVIAIVEAWRERNGSVAQLIFDLRTAKLHHETAEERERRAQRAGRKWVRL